MINDVLDLAKIEAGRMDVNYADVDVKELVSTVVEQTQSIASERKLELSFQVAEQVGTIRTDEVKLRQILLNLVSNGLKFTEEGGVTIIAQPVTTNTVAGGESERIAISVQDTGIGISKEMQEHIFEAFYQVDSSNTRKYGGTGLGLSIVNQLTLLLGGKIELASNSGMGSIFTITLPLQGKQMPAETSSLRLYQTPPASGAGILSTPHTSNSSFVEPEKKRADDERYLVLAIDDNPDVLSLINNVLENSSYNVVGIDDPSQAIEMVQRLNPDAITLDVMMPNVNGWQILSQLKSNPNTAHIPVIMLTVLEDRSTGYVLGADEYLVKPVEREDLLNTLRRLAAHRVSTKRALVTTESPSTENREKHRPIYDTENATDTQTNIVLLVEDEPRVQAQLGRMLTEAGFQVRTANKQELTQTIQYTQPDMIALHLDLPKKSNSGSLLSPEGKAPEVPDTQPSSEQQH
jgi:two-component system, chemotaxis family, sensor kinase CheA